MAKSLHVISLDPQSYLHRIKEQHPLEAGLLDRCIASGSLTRYALWPLAAFHRSIFSVFDGAYVLTDSLRVKRLLEHHGLSRAVIYAPLESVQL